MKLVKQSFEILEQEIPARKMDDYSGSHFREQYLKNMYVHIEKCGRTCYRSEDKITEGSAERFVNGLIKTKHYSVLEHGVVYLHFNMYSRERYFKYCMNPYSKANSTGDAEHDTWNGYCTTSYRVIIENGWEDDLQYLCKPTEYHEKRHTVLLHSCIHVYKDLTRHRKMSFSIESTRYCNYSKTDKFGEMKFVLPPWLDLPEGSYEFSKPWDEDNWEWLLNNKAIYVNDAEHTFLTQLSLTESNYNNLTDFKWKQEQAAEILPQCTAADVIMSGFASDWEFVFRLRSDTAETGKPHPLVEELMTPLRDTFIKNNYV